MFCKWCKDIIPEDDICDNKICIYLDAKIRSIGLLQFYLKCYSILEPSE